MKFITIRDLKFKSSEVWRRLEAEKDLVVTSNGRPIAILTGINENNLEESLAALRRSRAVLAVNKLQLQSVEKGKDKFSMDEIEAEIDAVRRGRSI
ncbi:MAG: type II toxin-antitoxin system prevent-host-death family antitoxin [Firmicutes bacterium]|nr:type II toxin-antitoxin system prevent-host-death family antitoxin [Bacillota bacterium]